MKVTLIGIDCATQSNKVGIARGYFEAGKATVQDVMVGSKQTSMVSIISEWIKSSSVTLIALDAPLGWPISLGKAVYQHQAGRPIEVDPNFMFRRLTDRVVKQKIGKQSLDVGADRIARTAHAALELLDNLRDKTGEEIPLAWEPNLQSGAYAIEVYPAATLKAHNIAVLGYKKSNGFEPRKKLLACIEQYIVLPHDTSLMGNNDNALDAVVCLLAGTDFLIGKVIEPSDVEIAKKEGWIWVSKPSR